MQGRVSLQSLVAYQSLYRKYRPQRFAELVGQDHVTTALRNAVREDRVGHAYLFSGPRGTGKTTTARILAKAAQLPHLGADGEPCGKCENCVGGRRRHVPRPRRARRRVATTASTRCATSSRACIPRRRRPASKVYILDEVHMLSRRRRTRC